MGDPASHPGRVPWREWTLVHLIRRQAGAQGHRPFVRFEDGQAFTFRSLDAWTDGLAGSLAALGVGPGDRVLGLLGNRAESIGMLFATVKLGAVWVPVNTGLRGAFLQHQLHNAEPRLVVLEDRLAANLREVAAGPVAPEALVIVGDAAATTPPCLAAARRLMFPELRALPAPADFELVTPAPGDVAMIMYTSGTTGPSKGVLMPHGHAYLAGLGLAEGDAPHRGRSLLRLHAPVPHQRPAHAVHRLSHRRRGGGGGRALPGHELARGSARGRGHGHEWARRDSRVSSSASPRPPAIGTTACG